MRDDPADPATRLANAGWRQGSAIDAAGLAALGYGAFTCGIVLSQDCDVLHVSKIEPFVEIVLGTITTSARPDCEYGKNPRHLDVPMSAGTQQAHAALNANDRVRVAKADLITVSICSEYVLDREATRLLIEWVAKRYTRPAWLDAFNARLDTARSKLDSLFKSKDGTVISGIWFALDPVEAKAAKGAAGVSARVAAWGPRFEQLLPPRRHCPPAATHASGPESLLALQHATNATVKNAITAFIVPLHEPDEKVMNATWAYRVAMPSRGCKPQTSHEEPCAPASRHEGSL